MAHCGQPVSQYSEVPMFFVSFSWEVCTIKWQIFKALKGKYFFNVSSYQLQKIQTKGDVGVCDLDLGPYPL